MAALAGVAAASGALGVAELVAGIAESYRSPIIDIGDRVIDNVPAFIKDIAIAVFGTNDKLALLVGIGATLAIVAAVVGIVALRRSVVAGVIGIGLFGALGAGAAVASGRGIGAAIPSLVGAIAGIAVLLFLARLAHGRRTALTAPPMQPGMSSRRSFLAAAGTVGAGAAVLGVAGRRLEGRFSAEPARSQTVLPAAASRAAVLPPGVDFEIPGLAPFVTPNADFYRIDTALLVPQVNVDSYTLRVHGMVDQELEFTYRDLLDSDLVESDITLTCVSNEVGGRLVGNARWLGLPLAGVLAEAGVAPGADQVVGRSIDGYTCGFPVSAATDGRDALIAIGMNGEPLPLEHGYPVRLVVPGLYGYVSATKWLTEIEVTTFAAFDHYWERRGWAEEAPIKVQSRIDVPAALATIPAGESVIAGVAWAQTRGIESVEVRIDDGPWRTAELAAAAGSSTWRQWRLPWNVTPGRHTITVRATDRSGTTQTEARARPIPDGATGWHSVVAFGGDSG